MDFHEFLIDVNTVASPQHPYRGLDNRAFWSRSVANGADVVLPELFRPKFQLDPQDRIATAGSCFAHHIGRYLGRMGLSMIDLEPAPLGIAGANVVPGAGRAAGLVLQLEAVVNKGARRAGAVHCG